MKPRSSPRSTSTSSKSNSVFFSDAAAAGAVAAAGNRKPCPAEAVGGLRSFVSFSSCLGFVVGG